MAVKHGIYTQPDQKNLSVTGLTATQKAERFGAVSKEQKLSVSGLTEKEKLAAYGTKAKHERSKSTGGFGTAHKEHEFGFGNHAQDKLYMGAGVNHPLH